jgi:hypothetical protein
MKNFLFYAFLSVLFSACTNPVSTESPAWAAFKKCATNACIKEAVDVKNAFLSNPQQLLTNFQATYEKGDDHVIGWLYMVRDSLLLNPKMATIEARLALQQKLIAAAKPFENDPKVKEMAKSVMDEIGAAAIMSETEDGEALDPSSDPITGTYSYDKGDNGNGDVSISQISADKFKFKISVTGGPPSHTGGYMEGTANLVQNKGTYSTKEFNGECSLEFTFGKDVTIKTLKGDPASCGFGMNVMADGVYPRKSHNDPFLSKKDAAAAAKLIGEWQSTTDPKSSIKIGDGVYQDVYVGTNPMPALRYIYSPMCPKDCNPVAKTPCLRVIGQDDVCYTIVKADGKTLELSQIGGTGNTNKYVKLTGK